MGFDASKCDFSRCKGECLTRCPYVSYTENETKEQISALIKGETARILKECITCAACNEYCPLGANPWDLILWRQEQTQVLGIPKNAKPASDWLVKPRMVRHGKPGGPLFSLCGIYEVVPQQEFLTGMMFDEATLIGGGEYCCGFTETHLGRGSRPYEFLPTLVKNLTDAAQEYGVSAIVFTHDACYNVLTTVAMQERIMVPFRPVHILEYIRNWLKEHPDRITPLNMKIAYQGGCTTRYAAKSGEIWKDWLDEILTLIGVTCVEDKRKFTGDNRLCCCCSIFHTQHDRAMKFQRMNIQDAIDAGAEGYCFICPACVSVMRMTCKEMNLTPYYITQLVKLALLEDLGKAGTAAFGYPVL